MFTSLARALAGFSLALKQPLQSFCELETAHGDALVTKAGHYVTLIRVDGMQKMGERKDFARITEAMRLDLSGALEARGHAIVGWYISDPDAALVELNNVNLNSCRSVAREAGLNFDDILDERAHLWPSLMHWEAAYFVVWTQTSVLTKEERKQLKAEYAANVAQVGPLGDTQRFTLRSEIMAARHGAFTSRVLSALRTHDVAASLCTPHDALKLARETMYRELSGSAWRAILPGDKVMPRCPEDDAKAPKADHVLWPPLRDQIFYTDAVTQGGQRVAIGDNIYGCVDMYIGPEDPRPFVELAATLGQDRIPWRMAVLIEGGGRGSMQIKDIGASFLSMFPGNADLRRAFAFLREQRETENHIGAKMRVSFATWAPVDEPAKLRRRMSLLSQRIEGWGNAKSTTIVGDPLEGVMGTVPGLSLASTANPSLALLGDALAMLPWNLTASPWESGSVVFRRPDGGIWCYDPAGGRKRPLVCDVIVAPPGSGKSVLANTINVGLCLSSAGIGTQGAKLPLIGKVDIGRSAEGFVQLVQEALGPDRRHEAIFVSMQFAPGFEFNIFDLQVGLEYPLPLERAFLQNFLALATAPPNRTTPFEGLSQLIEAVIDEAYRICASDEGGKHYRRGVEPEVDRAIGRYKIDLHPDRPFWRDVVNALCDLGQYRLAEIAQRHAVPVVQDLISAVRTDQVQDGFKDLRVQETSESAPQIFERYIEDLIRRFPTLNAPTQLDFGPARIIVIDLQSVAPKGSPAAQRQTEMMYLLARHILARNFFLHPEYLPFVPERVYAYHQKRFSEVKETVKRLDYDEWHRTEGSPLICAQAERDVREGRKHNVQIGFASQLLGDFSDGILAQSTGRFVLRAGDQREVDDVVKRFALSEASAKIIRYRLTGPKKTGAPFLALLSTDGGAAYEQLLINSLGPVELWALSTTPGDTNLRNRLYARVGFSEGLRRLSKVFPAGSAIDEIERRTKARLRKGDLQDKAGSGVVEELANELIDGHGLGLVLRRFDEPETRPAPRPIPVAAE
jgi:intracellular multiplication protein IcmB